MRAEFVQAKEKEDERVRDAREEHPAPEGEQDTDPDHHERVFQQPIPEMMRVDGAKRKHNGEDTAENREVTLMRNSAKHGRTGNEMSSIEISRRAGMKTPARRIN
jgi:hypothetical protein